MDQEEPAGRHFEELDVMRNFLFAFLAISLFPGCSKTPESQTAVEVGQKPKQIVDKATDDVNKAMQKETQRQQPDPEKKE
jgi:hypothetical protein